MNNDDNFKSSRVSTTPFNNNENGSNPFERVRNNNLKNINNRKDNSSLNLPNNNINNVPRDNLDDVTNKDNIKENNDNQKSAKNQNQKQANNSKNGNKFGQGSVGNNLRNRLNTIPSNLDDAKKKAIEKGTEALKKSANPLAKAAGMGLGAYQKHKNKKDEKEQEEKTEEEKENESENQEDVDSENQTQEERRGRQLLKKLLPIIGICGGILLILLVLLAVLSPVITVSSWFNSLFHHKGDDASSYTIYNEKDSENYKAEQDYNNAILGSKDGSIKGIIPEYQEKYGVTIDWYLLNSLITYRYTSGSGNIYSSDNIEELDEEELNKRLEELQNESEDSDSSSSDNSGVDFSAASKKIKAFASLMIINENGSYTTDKEKDGKVYNNVLNSSTFKKYYKPLFNDENEESYKKILNEIYDFADFERELWEKDSHNNGGVVGDTSIVYLQSCTKPKQYTYKNINGHQVYDMALVNEGTNYPLYLSLRDYIKGVIYRENFKTEEKYREATKVQAIMALSFLLRDPKSGFDLKSGEMYFPTETCRQAACDPNYGCTSVSGVASYSGTDRGGGTIHRPLNEKEQAYLDSILDEVFGLIIVKNGVTSSSFSGSSDMVAFNYCNTLGGCSSCHAGSCVGQTESNRDSEAGMDYKAIFQKYFTSLDYDIINITEGLYTENATFTNSEYNEEVVYYNQGNYASTKFCGTSSKTIKGSGCGIVSAAIVASSLTGNKQYDPIYMNNLARNGKDCGANLSGTQDSFFPYMASKLNLHVESVSKSQTDKVVEALKTGKALVIAHMGKGHFTDQGHFIVLSAINEKGQAKVYDPGHIANTEKWYDMNSVIADEVKGNYYIYTR